MLWIIDGSNMFYRAHHTASELRDKNGNLTGGFFGFMSSLNKLIREKSPDGVLVVWDGAKSARRLQILPSYKGQRKQAKKDAGVPVESIYSQILELREQAMPGLGIPQVHGGQYEADDLIFTIVDLFRGRVPITIVSTDTDFYQLVDKEVWVYNPLKKPRYAGRGVKKGMMIGLSNFLEVTGFGRPAQYLDGKILMGDSSDNIPGVKGIGPATAVAIIEQFGSLEEVLNSKAKIMAGKNKTWKKIFEPKNTRAVLRNIDMIDLEMEGEREDREEVVIRAVMEKTKFDLLGMADLFEAKSAFKFQGQLAAMEKNFEQLQFQWRETRSELVEILGE
jgi:DNA polymerase I